MKQFKDNADRTWVVTVNIESVKRVRSLLSIDLMEAVEGKLLERLIADPVLLCDVIYAICKPEADSRKLTDEDFGRAMAGDAIGDATNALLEDLVDFFPAARRKLLAKSLEKLQTMETKAMQLIETRLDSPQLDAQMDAALEELEAALDGIGNASGSLPDSSASIPDR